jgi:hypothetical protein
MTTVMTYRLAYLDQEVDLCDECTARGDHECGTLGPVQHGAHDGECGSARHDVVEQIHALRTEAATAGDHAQVLICDIALGAIVLDEDTTIESLRIAAFVSSDDRRRIAERFGDPVSARAECERVIALAHR